MNQCFYEVDLIGIVLSLCLHYQMRKENRTCIASKIILRLVFSSTVTLVMDFTYYLLNGTIFPGSILIHKICMILYFASAGFSSYYIMCYTYYKLHKNLKFNRLIGITPLVLLLVMAFVSPLTGWTFRIDNLNEYHRGSLHFVHLFITYGYMIVSAFIAYLQSHREILTQKKKYCMNLCFFACFPFIGGIFRGIFFGNNTATPAIIIAVALITLETAKQEASLDYLTQLYNRKQLDLYLEKKSKLMTTGTLHLILFDIDYFKKINDQFGHIEGDNAVVILSTVLRQVFSNTDTFLARYGGDEFAAVTTLEEHEIIQYLQKVEELLALYSEGLPYTISLSSGYARYKGNSIDSIKNLIQMADKEMYFNKNIKKNAS